MGRTRADSVVEVVPPEVALTQADGGQLGTFVANMAEFFRQAGALEGRAHARLAEARSMRAPANGSEDAALQAFVRQVNDELKEREAFWEHIRTLAFRFHKRIVSFQNRGVAPLAEAAEIGNRLHAQYVGQERRRVQEEEARLRREQAERDQRARAEELERLESAAFAREEESPDLSPREQTFVATYARSGDAVRSAEEAGYKHAFQSSGKLLASTKIQLAVKAAVDAIVLRNQAKALSELPVESEAVSVQPDIQGGGDRTTWAAEVVEEIALRDAVIEGRHGIPRDVLTVNRVKLNEYARSMRTLIDRWPGVRAKKTTRIV